MNIDVHNVEIIDHSGREYFAVAYQVEGEPLPWLKLMPTDILETRAAEYGFNPATDMDEIVELIMYEKYIDPPNDDDDDSVVEALHTAPTVEAARDSLRRRLRAAKGNGQLKGLTGQSPLTAIAPDAKVKAKLLDKSGTGDPLAFIKDKCLMDPAHLQVKRDFVAKLRQEQQEHRQKRKERKAAQGSSADNAKRRARPSALALRRQLFEESTELPRRRGNN